MIFSFFLFLFHVVSFSFKNEKRTIWEGHESQESERDVNVISPDIESVLGQCARSDG